MADATIITGQYVRIEQTLASAGERLLARMVDAVVVFIYEAALSVVVFYAFDVFSNDQFPEGLIVAIILLALLPALCYSLGWELFNRGQSPGKRLLGLRVVMKDGSTPTLGAYLLRWLFLLIDIHLFQCIGLLSILLTRNSQRIGDLAAGTLVIKEKNYHRINVTLDEFAHLSADYRPVFPQAENLSLEQVDLIGRTLSRHDAERPQRILELGGKVRRYLKINPPVSNEALLFTLTRDYQYYALEEI
ncbi:MAG: RDD family protein [Tannerella sp.]|jgi:uncharacterized RDD family membrane protein YckC|nr:RDD family protein [Tannerella sp.]